MMALDGPGSHRPSRRAVPCPRTTAIGPTARKAGALALACLATGFEAARASEACEHERVEVRVLGSGGPDFADGRAATGYALLLDGAARLLVDAGPGTAARFHREDLDFAQVSGLLVTHLHVEHVADLVAYLKAAWFGPRTSDLPIYGPPAGGRMPSIEGFLRELIGTPATSAFGYLSGYLDASDGYNFAVRPQVVEAATLTRLADLPEDLDVQAISVDHGPNPALAWRVALAGCVIAFSGDTAATGSALTTLAKGADLFIAHHAVPVSARGAALKLHMPPQRIGEVAAEAGVGQLLLSHRMRRTRGVEGQSLEAIRQHYPGTVQFAEDGQRIRP